MDDITERCSACGGQTERFWSLADKVYCRDCITKASGENLESLTHSLEEDVSLGFIKGFLTALWSGLLITAGLTGVIIVVFLAINVIVFLEQPNQRALFVKRMIRTIPLVVGLSFAFVGTISIPMSLALRAFKSSKKISFEGNDFVITKGASVTRLSLADCIWMMPRLLAMDACGFYLPGAHPILVRSTNPRLPINFACGLTDASHQIWKTFLTLHRVPFYATDFLVKRFLWMVGGASGGCLLGASAGLAAVQLTGLPWAIGAFGFLGFLDGLIWGLLRALVATTSSEILRKMMGDASRAGVTRALATSLGGFILGIKVIGAPFGMLSGFGIGFLNGVVLLVVLSNCVRALECHVVARPSSKS